MPPQLLCSLEPTSLGNLLAAFSLITWEGLIIPTYLSQMDNSSSIIGGFPATFDFYAPKLSTPPEYEQARAAGAIGDVAAVKAAFEHWNETPHDPEFKVFFSAALFVAIQNNHVPVVSYLLDQDIDIRYSDFAEATKKKLYPMLQLLLDHGWDINRPMASNNPPALQ